MICLDSDFMISLLRGNEEAKIKAKQLEEESREVVSTAINALEIYVGIVAVDGVAGKRVEVTRDFISNITILPLDGNAAERAAYIQNTLKKQGKGIGLKDSMIAGIVIENRVNILTRNIKHFERVAGIKIETW